MKAWEDDAAPRLNSADRPVHMARLCRDLNKTLPEDAILVADGGFAGHWTGLLYDTKKPGRSFIPDRGFASIGYGLPGGMGAALAAPDRPVVAISGDGGFNMTLGELETARRTGCGLTVIVVNNAASGYVKALQHAMMGGRYQSADLIEMDYAAIARTMGCGGIRVEDPRRWLRHFGRAWRNATGQPLSTSSSPAIPRKCCPPSTTARWRSSAATGWLNARSRPIADRLAAVSRLRRRRW